ncbi:uncharacterized protein NESG_00070 [Nematocida ausubeli]|uniref:Uncharacterized protein n=1 Tax=Nematocida ausubeli (strain ATCC PRA-371 / ERTm2) TaxID=1913371 RepID=H8ZE04_NEMA1|nr:uncharacterized protein NESG_00070 [Nematocida ausubeli]EHY65379.1 hypothetical protein NERG_01825 [Nematocida ausubeli]KAI5147754.1 hypothetical protein NEAUS05_1041 [Nematocida ausubeli]KFG26999.1 hypothetical protein NESG_00070 [Nematocida ausubeli]
MEKKYSGMVFTKTPSLVPRTEEEKEIFANLNRKIHKNDLEDDFFELALGLREGPEEDSDSDMMDASDGESHFSLDEEHPLGISAQSCPAEKSDAPAESLKKDCFASLIEQVNKQSGGSFSALSKLFTKEKRVKRTRRPEVSIEECNNILSRMGSHASNYTETYEEEEAQVKPKARAKTPKKQKVEEKCENWEDTFTSTIQNQPNII